MRSRRFGSMHVGAVLPLATVLLGVAACGQDPAFTEKTTYLEPEVSVDKDVGSPGQGGELDASGQTRSEVDPDGELVASAPGISPEDALSGEGMGGVGGVLKGGDGGVRDGVGEGTGVVVPVPTPPVVDTRPPVVETPVTPPSSSPANSKTLQKLCLPQKWTFALQRPA
jgi:hypothetical protein